MSTSYFLYELTIISRSSGEPTTQAVLIIGAHLSNSICQLKTSDAGQTMLMQNGQYADYSEEEATKILSEEEVTVICDMHQGSASATAWGCDLTYDYVKINADYRS